jgi:BirA family transcriptional regulator, biotin operon repressor / biotin---[acetyl-CoA-carboxylase] ligase
MVASLKIVHYRRLRSTNTTAYRLAQQSAPEWTIVVADVQTKGRGRGRKKWESPKGGLWFSILLRPRIPTPRLPLLQFLAAIATRQALENKTGVSVKLKWPNDLVLANAKLGGILIESKTLADRISFAILGIGLNINQSKAQLPPGAVSLRLVSGKQHDLRLLLRAILDQMRWSYDDLGNPSKIMEEWWRNCIHRPLRIQVTLANDTVTGISTAIDEDGSLLIETDDRGVRRLNEGSLRILSD